MPTEALADALAEIEREIEAAMEEGKQTLLATAERARRIGEGLLRAKAVLPHGEYLPWAQGRFGFTTRHISNFTRTAEHWSEIKEQIGNGFPVWTALRLVGNSTNGGSVAQEDRWTCLACEGRGYLTRDPEAGRGHPPGPPTWRGRRSG